MKRALPAAATVPHGAERWKGVASIAIVVLCWSGFNIVSRFGSTGAFTPFDMAALRFGVSGVVALPFFLYSTRPAHYPRYMALALFGGLGYGLFAYAGFAFAPSAHAGIFVNGGIPFWTALLLALGGALPRSGSTIVALLLTTSGLVLIGGDSLFAEHGGKQWLGDLLFLPAAACWATFGILVRHWRLGARNAVLGIASFSLLIYLPVYIAWLPSTIHRASWNALALQGVYQGIVAALLAAGMYAYATERIGASRASMALALVPATSAFGANLLLGETINAAAIVGILVVSAGAALGAAPRGGHTAGAKVQRSADT